jgi:hypothetical protein
LATDSGGVQKSASDAATDAAASDGGTAQQPADAASADAQTPALGCYIEKTGAELVPTCAPAGTTAENGACTDSHECTPGLACVDVSFSLECADASGCDAASCARSWATTQRRACCPAPPSATRRATIRIAAPRGSSARGRLARA